LTFHAEILLKLTLNTNQSIKKKLTLNQPPLTRKAWRYKGSKKKP